MIYTIGNSETQLVASIDQLLENAYTKAARTNDIKVKTCRINIPVATADDSLSPRKQSIAKQNNSVIVSGMTNSAKSTVSSSLPT